MRIAIFSDIHGNRIALERMLQDTKNMGIDLYIFVGDIIGYYNETKEVIGIMKDMTNLISVRGNHDNNYLESINNKGERSNYANKYGISYLLDYTYEEIDYLKSLQTNNYMIIDNQYISILHGSGKDCLNGRIYPDTNLDNSNWIQENTVYILGHTHYKMLQNYNSTILINPGSLGQPRDKGGFSYCIFDSMSKTCEFKTVKVESEHLLNRLKMYEVSRELITYLSGKL